MCRSRKLVRTGLEKRQIDYVIRECRKGGRTPYIAEEMEISQGRVQQVWAAYRATGMPPAPQRPGRPGIRPAGGQTDAVLALHHGGVQISEKMECRITGVHKVVASSTAGSRRRKRARHEHRYPNATWHADWHGMEDYRFQGC